MDSRVRPDGMEPQGWAMLPPQSCRGILVLLMVSSDHGPRSIGKRNTRSTAVVGTPLVFSSLYSTCHGRTLYCDTLKLSRLNRKTAAYVVAYYAQIDRKSVVEGKIVSVRVDLCCCRFINKKT